MLSSSCLKRPIEVVIFFSVFMNKNEPGLQRGWTKGAVVISFQCVRGVFRSKSGFGHLSGFRFGVLSQKQMSTLAVGLFSSVNITTRKADLFISGLV